MKEAIGGVSIFQIVILFILLFTAIMCLTINNANAFQIKDEITNIIELHNGDFLTKEGNLNNEIVTAVADSAYRTVGKCDEGFIGYDRNGNKVSAGQQASICIKCVNITNSIVKKAKGNIVPLGNVNSYYYQIEVFYQLDLPVISQIYNFRSKSETKTIYDDAKYCKQG